MTLAERRRYLIASQKKKNWFDFSKVTGGANRYYQKLESNVAYVKGDKLIVNRGAYNGYVFLYDSSTTLPKGVYMLSFTVYSPIASDIYVAVSKKSNDLINSLIYNKYLSVKLNNNTDFKVPFMVTEETIIALSMQGIGNASNSTTLGVELTNIRIDRIGDYEFVNYFSIDDYYNKTGWTVEDGIAYSKYCYNSNDFGQYGSLPFELEAGKYKVSYDIMLSGTGGAQYMCTFQANNSIVVRQTPTLPSKDKYHNISYDVTLTQKAQCRIALISVATGNTTYLKNIIIEKVG